MTLRLATPEDAAAVAAIYAPVVRDTAISFEVDPPDAAEVASRIAATLPARPWLVAEDAGEVLGYAYAGAHRARAAYAWSVEPSVYVAAAAHGRGVGRALYTALFAVLRAQGFAVAYAGATLPNDASVGLHRAMGFADVGVFRRVGFKHGRWHDVWWGALDLLPDRGTAPAAPRSITDLAADGRLAAALGAVRQLLQPAHPMHRIYSGPDATVAHLVRDALEQHGLAAVVRGERRGALAGETAWTDTQAEVWAGDAARLDEARALGAETTAGPETQTSWTCPGCREEREGAFGACWSCGAERPAQHASPRSAWLVVRAVSSPRHPLAAR